MRILTRFWLMTASALLLMELCFDAAAAQAFSKKAVSPVAAVQSMLLQAPKDEPSSVLLEQRESKAKRRRILSKWGELHERYPGIFILRGSGKERKVALTFDDVPDPRYTPQVLDVLAKYKVKATFFVVGSRAAAHPELVRRMRSEGHTIGNHSYDHALFSRLPDAAFHKQILRTDAVLRPLAGYSPRFIRPPYGEIKPGQLEWAGRRGYIVVNWDVDSIDWRSISSRQVLANIRKTLRPGSIVLQHAGGGASQDLSGTVKALPELIRMLHLKGYQIVTLQELLHQPSARQ